MAKTGKRKRTRLRRRRQRRGGEEFNFQKAIEKTGMEFHIPSYRFAGPGTHMAKRLNGRTGYSLYLFTKEYKDVTSENLMSSSSALALSVAAPVRPSYKASLGSKGGTISRSCSNDFNWGPSFCLGWIRTPIFQLLVSPLVLTLPLSSQSLHTLHSWFDPYGSCGGHLDFLGSNGGTRESSNRKIHRWYWFLGQNHLWKPFQHVSGLVLRLHFWHGGLAPFPRVCNLIIQPFWGHGAVIDVIASPSSLGFQVNEILL